ncbi:hypothetical protein [Hydrogenophaga sp. RWCD_12]|uniref:hypothetical protein n=1 Tax=Hydrogenophaga sp. RWCD_12 TaxID=3391190 RepID=UPI003984C169
MDVLNVVRSARRPLAVASMAAVVAALAACYVVPIDPRTGQAVPAQTPVAMPAPAAPLVFTARLYPANDLASGFGVVHASVTNDLQGRGTFNTVIGGESFSGEATRKAGSSREGLANGAGNRGGYITCAYTMNSATMGSGTCRLSSGALFSMHVGN